MTITDEVRAATQYETWKLERIQDGGDYTLEAYEQHLVGQRHEIRLQQIHGLAVSAAENDDPLALLARLQQIARLSDPEEGTS